MCAMIETMPVSGSRYMQIALETAASAAQEGEVPVGAVLVDAATGDILASSGNRVETDRDPTAHAEIVVIREAAALLKAFFAARR